MNFYLKKPPDAGVEAITLQRVVQQLLEGSAMHAVEFDTAELAAFRMAIREIARRFERLHEDADLLILTGETNKTIQGYHQLVERYIRELSIEKQQAVKVLAQSLLRVCNATEKSAQTLRQIEKELGAASQIQDIRDIRAKLADCVSAICRDAEAHEARFRELKHHLAEATSLLEPRDQVTGLGSVRSAEARMQELSAGGSHGYVLAFFLKNVDVVNRRFGYGAGDDVLRRFAAYLSKNLQGHDQLFRWRGPCFVVVTERAEALDTVEAEASELGLRGPAQEVESDGKSMVIRLTAATAVFSIPKGRVPADLPAKIDQFTGEQFKMAHAAR